VREKNDSQIHGKIYDKLYGNIHSKKNNYPSKNNAIIDSGATGNYLSPHSPQEARRITNKIITVTQPNGEKIRSNTESQLKILKELSKESRKASVFKEITFPLISVAKLCDNNCTVIFQKHKGYIINKNKVIAEPTRDIVSKLWTLKLNNSNDCNTKHEKNFINNMTQVKEDNNNNIVEHALRQSAKFISIRLFPCIFHIIAFLNKVSIF